MAKTLMQRHLEYVARLRHLEYVARLRAQGVKLLAYACPHCSFSIEVQRAPRGDTWDTLSECPKCGKMHFRVATHTKAKAVLPPREAAE